MSFYFSSESGAPWFHLPFGFFHARTQNKALMHMGPSPQHFSVNTTCVWFYLTHVEFSASVRAVGQQFGCEWVPQSFLVGLPGCSALYFLLKRNTDAGTAEELPCGANSYIFVVHMQTLYRYLQWRQWPAASAQAAAEESSYHKTRAFYMWNCSLKKILESSKTNTVQNKCFSWWFNL